MRYEEECVCRCRDGAQADPDADGMCLECWTAWQAPLDSTVGEHAPIADRSYLGTFGLRGAWTPWLMNRAGHLLAMRGKDFHNSSPAPTCPERFFGIRCGNAMSYREDGWKCYQHSPPFVLKHGDGLPRVPARARLPAGVAR